MMNGKNVSTFSGKITLDSCVVSYGLTVLHVSKLNENDNNLSSDRSCFGYEQQTETFNLLQRIARELVTENKYDDGKIATLNGKFVKFAFFVCKENLRLDESESRSYLAPVDLTGEELRFKKVSEFNRCIKASVYSLPLTFNEQHQPVAALSIQSTSQPSSETVTTYNDRVTTLENLFTQIKAQPKREPILREEKLLKNIIKKMELESETRNTICDRDCANPGKSNSAVTREKRMKELTNDEISEQFEKWKSELILISKGELQCERHVDYWKGGSAKRNLDRQLYVIRFDDKQIDFAMKCLKSLYARPEVYGSVDSQSLDYILKVLLPEFLARICMNVRKISYEEAEKKLSGDYYGHSSGEESEAFLSDTANKNDL